MTKVLAAVHQLFATYPALSAALVNIAVIVAAYLGLPLTGAELVYLVGVVTTLFGVIVHSNVVPLAKVPVTPVAAIEKGGYTAGATTVSELAPPPPAITVVKSDPVV